MIGCANKLLSRSDRLKNETRMALPGFRRNMSGKSYNHTTPPTQNTERRKNKKRKLTKNGTRNVSVTGTIKHKDCDRYTILKWSEERQNEIISIMFGG